MSLSNRRYAIVNRSDESIPVYEKLVSSEGHYGSITVGGEQIGEIPPGGFYTLIPNPENPPFTVSNLTSFEIIFLDYNGKVSHGFIETSPATTYPDYAWHAYQEPYHYYNSDGSGLVASKKETIDGKTYRVFTVCNKSPMYRSPSGKVQGYLAIGTKLATLESTSGVTYGDHMAFYRKKTSGGSWQPLVSGADYGFVDLFMTEGVTPDVRCIQ